MKAKAKQMQKIKNQPSRIKNQPPNATILEDVLYGGDRWIL